MASKGVVEHIEFSAYETGIEIPAVGTKYTLNGTDNANFKRYQDAFDDSPTNAFIIKTIVNYIIGDGLVDKNGVIKPHEYLSKQDLRLIVQDFKINGSAFPQSIYFNKNIIKIKHTPVMRVGLNINIDPKSTSYMEVNGFWYCWNYRKKFQYPPKFISAFNPNSTDNDFEISHIRALSSEPFFPFPDWYSGLKSAKIEAALIDDAVNHVLHGFQGKTIINVNNGGMMDEDEKKEVIKKVRKDWTGTENSDGVTVSVNESADEALVVDTIEPRGRNEQFVTYDETAEIKLQAAHQALNIIFSRPGSNGFSNNADEIAMATKSLYLGVINPLREIILDTFNQIFKKINPACEIDFVNFADETVISNDQEKEPLEFREYERDSDGKFGKGGGNSKSSDNKKSYSPPKQKTAADKLKEGESLDLGKIKTDEGKNINPSLEVALSIAGDSRINENGGREVKRDTISKVGDGRYLNSVYFEKDGIEYRVSNHELPGRRFMEAHNYKSVDDAVSNGESKNLFHKNNVEIIVKDGKIAKINKNFNY